MIQCGGKSFIVWWVQLLKTYGLAYLNPVYSSDGKASLISRTQQEGTTLRSVFLSRFQIHLQKRRYATYLYVLK